MSKRAAPSRYQSPKVFKAIRALIFTVLTFGSQEINDTELGGLLSGSQSNLSHLKATRTLKDSTVGEKKF